MKERTVPLGKALNSSNETIQRAALVTPNDIEEAQADVARNATALGRQMLETEEAGAAPVEEPPA